MGRERNWISVTWGQMSAQPHHPDFQLVLNPSFLCWQHPSAQVVVTSAANPSTFVSGPDQGQACPHRGMKCRYMGMVETYWSVGVVKGRLRANDDVSFGHFCG